MTLDEILKAMETILATAQHEQRDLTEDEQKEFDDLKAKADQLQAENEAAAEDRRTAMQARADEIAAIRARTTATLSASTAMTPAATADPAPQLIRPAGPVAEREFETFADFLAAAVVRPNDQRLAGLWHDAIDPNAVDHTMGTGQRGGFLVPTQFLNQIYEVGVEATIVRSRATVLPAGSSPDAEVTMPALDQTGTNPANMFGGLEFEWIAEGGEKPATDANFREISWTPHELAGHVTVTDKLLRNAPALGAWLAQRMPTALLSAEDAAFITGSGIARPLGFINAPAAFAQTRATAGSVTYADLVEMDSRLLGDTGIWVIAKGAKPVIKQIQDNSGGSPGVGSYVFAEGNLTLGVPDTLLGRPVVWTERAPALGQRGDISLVNLSEYIIKDGFGPMVSASEHVHFTRNKTVVKIFTNVDGKPPLTAPIKGLDGRDYSPFVVLAA